MSETFGVELELLEKGYVKGKSGSGIHPDTLKNVFRKTLSSCKELGRSGHESPKYWNLKYDGTCGKEITSPALARSKRGFQRLERVYETIKKQLLREYKNNDIFNAQTGLHVHLGLQNWTRNQKRNLFYLFATYEKIIYSILPPSRRGNKYSTPVARVVEHGMFLDGRYLQDNEDHYLAVHFRDLKLSRVEIRYGFPTFKGRSMYNWIVLLFVLADISKKIKDKFSFDSHGRIIQKNKKSDLIKLIESHKLSQTWLEDQKVDLIKWLSRKIYW